MSDLSPGTEEKSLSFLLPSPIPYPGFYPVSPSVLGAPFCTARGSGCIRTQPQEKSFCCACGEGIEQAQGQTCSSHLPLHVPVLKLALVPGKVSCSVCPQLLISLPVYSQQENLCSCEVDWMRRITHTKPECFSLVLNGSVSQVGFPILTRGQVQGHKWGKWAGCWIAHFTAVAE